jgi:hypothetical protein
MTLRVPFLEYVVLKDVNPKLAAGCQGFEFTAELNVLSDMLECKLVHGWLIDPMADAPTAAAVGNRTYNELLDRVLAGNEAALSVSRYQAEIDNFRLQNAHLLNDEATSSSADSVDLLDASRHVVAARAAYERLAILLQKQNEAQERATSAHLIEHFLAETSHQLTSYGLELLHTTLQEGELCIFFRNNHYGTMTKHTDGHLYLLVTDLGYANTPSIVWEKLDVVDGDTEFCNSQFAVSRVGSGAGVSGHPPQSGSTLTPEQLMAASTQNDVDYQLALRLSMEGTSQHPQSSGSAVALPRATSSAPTFATIPDDLSGQCIAVGIPVGNHPSSQGAWSSDLKSSPATLTPPMHGPVSSEQEAADLMLAMQLQDDHEASPSAMDDDASFRLAQQLQNEENQQAAVTNRTNTATLAAPARPPPPPPSSGRPQFPPSHAGVPSRSARPTATASAGSSCIVM